MIDEIEKLTAQSILSIPGDLPEKIFPNDKNLARIKYHRLMRFWHPDSNNTADATKVSSHLIVLYKAACKKIENGTWTEPNVRRYKCRDGVIRSVTFKFFRPYYSGFVYYGRSIIAIEFGQSEATHGENFLTTVKSFNYPDAAMKAAHESFLPKIKSSFAVEDGRFVIVLENASDMYSIADLIKYAGGTDQRHVAWIMNRLYGLACVLAQFKISHNAITPNNVFIRPKDHTAHLYLGWEFSTRFGSRIKFLPDIVHKNGASSVIRSRVSSNSKLDLSMIRYIGRSLLGDPVGRSLAANDKIAKPVRKFLTSPAYDNAYREFNDWENGVLPKAFGPKKFLPFNIDLTKMFTT